jgi:sugar phosphate isomerase/epimerase
MDYSRRELARMALAGLALPRFAGDVLRADTRFGGVMIGVQTYSFRSLPTAAARLAAVKSMGVSSIELMSGDAEGLAGAPAAPTFGGGRGTGRPGGPAGPGGPSASSTTAGAPPSAPAPGVAPSVPAPREAAAGASPAAGSPTAPAPGPGGGQGRRGRATLTPEQEAEQAAARATAREELRKWRLAATDDRWKAVRKQVNDAGADLRILCYNMNVNTTQDDEIDYAFRMAKAMGVKAISSSTQISMAKRLVPFLEKYKIPFAFHGHAEVNNPDETSTEATFETALSVNPYIMANLDIGHYVVAGGDPIAFINKHHARITNLHLKDRTKAVAADAAKDIAAKPAGNLPFGQGETPIKDVLRLLKKMKWNIPANIEFEYNGDPLVEVPKCIQYCKDALV